MLLEEPLKPNKAQKQVEEEGLLFMEEVDKEDVKDMSLADFLFKYITNWNKKYVTFFVDDPDQEESYAGANRSLTDLTRLAMNYYDTNVVEVRNTLLELVDKKRSVGTMICEEIERRVFFHARSIDDRDTRDEFGWKFNKPQTKFPDMKKKKK